MTTFRRKLGLALVIGAGVATLSHPASAETGAPQAGYDGPHVVDGPAGVVCASDVSEAKDLPALGACMPMPGPSTISYGCGMVGADATDGNQHGTVTGSATSTDVRVFYTEITCTVYQDFSGTAAAVGSAGAYARNANVSFTYVLPSSNYHVCASALVRYVENNVVKVRTFFDSLC